MLPGNRYYWMKNEEWYYYDDDDIGEAHLTDKAPPEAIQSFREYRKQVDWEKQHPGICR